MRRILIALTVLLAVGMIATAALVASPLESSGSEGDDLPGVHGYPTKGAQHGDAG
jgi:hypothetical protein